MTRAWLVSAFAALAGLVGACSNPTDVVVPPVEALVASGDSQYGTADQVLTAPLQVVVRAIATQQPRSGLTIAWTVQRGDASIVGTSVTATDSTGSARATVRLGQSPGTVVIRAMVQEQNQAFADFRLFLVDRPVLSELSPTTAAPGASVTLTGENFSPVADQNVVLFSGIRGRVTSASLTELEVTVPRCLPERSVAVTVQLGAVASVSRTLSVTAGGEVQSLEVGELVDAADAGGFGCLTLPGDGTATYAILAQSGSALGAATHPFRLVGLSATAPLASASGAAAVSGSTPLRTLRSPYDPGPRVTEARHEPARGDRAAGTLSDAHARFHEELRELERRLVRERGPDASTGGGTRQTSADQIGDRVLRPSPSRAAPGEIESARSGAALQGPAAAPPSVGERRTFHVYQGPQQFTQVTAVARFVGERAALFVDEEAPSGGYTLADLELYSERFDDFIHPAVTGRFGSESDIDGNQRVVILFSPAVNALTAAGATGFVGGFFFGIDLMPGTQGSNEGEVFYTLVPDPDGIFSDPRPKEDLLQITPAILAHEFQHMAHFNQRVLLLGAESTEALWLSEGLAQYAEELVAREYASEGDDESVEIFRGGARDRSRRYLAEPADVSVVYSVGQGSLSERGAGFLHVLYLADRFGSDVVTRLTRTTRLGTTNVAFETGTDWPVVLSDWWAAVRMDGTGAESGVTAYPTVDLRSFLGDPFPLAVEALGGVGFTRSGSLPSSSVAYYEVTPAAGGSTTVRIGGEGGGTSPPQARLRMRVIRVR